MDTLHKVKEGILQFCASHESKHDEAENLSMHCDMELPEDGRQFREKAQKLKLRISNDKRFRISFADLIINRKDLEVLLFHPVDLILASKLKQEFLLLFASL